VGVLDDRLRVERRHDVPVTERPVIAAAKSETGDADRCSQRDLGVREDGRQDG
jgi:hypothetical protein